MESRKRSYDERNRMPKNANKLHLEKRAKSQLAPVVSSIAPKRSDEIEIKRLKQKETKLEKRLKELIKDNKALLSEAKARQKLESELENKKSDEKELRILIEACEAQLQAKTDQPN